MLDGASGPKVENQGQRRLLRSQREPPQERLVASGGQNVASGPGKSGLKWFSTVRSDEPRLGGLAGRAPTKAHAFFFRSKPRHSPHATCPRRNRSVDIAADLLYSQTVTSAEFKRWLERQGCSFEPGKGGHLTVRLGAHITSLPMHGSGKEIGKGLERRIKKALGLK